jgi:hypothetical protein
MDCNSKRDAREQIGRDGSKEARFKLSASRQISQNIYCQIGWKRAFSSFQIYRHWY